MKLIKLALAVVCTVVVMFGIVYNVAVLPFSSPLFDVISWLAIGVACLVLWLIGRRQ